MAGTGQFRELNAEVVTVSTDTKFVLLAWKQDEKMLEGVKYPMGSDPTGKIFRMFGRYDEETGLALRGAFITNPEGILLNSEVNFYNLGVSMPFTLERTKFWALSATFFSMITREKW